MDTQFWHERWESGQIGFHQKEINSHLKSFWDKTGITAGSLVFVPLCGKTSDMLWLLGEGYKVLGVELSPLAVKSFFMENNLSFSQKREGDFIRFQSGDDLTVLCGNYFMLTPEHLKDIKGIYDRASLIALPPDMRQSYADHMKKVFPKGLSNLLITIEYDQQKMSGPPFCVDEDEVKKLYSGNELSLIYENENISENPNFQERGLSSLKEKVYLIQT